MECSQCKTGKDKDPLICACCKSVICPTCQNIGAPFLKQLKAHRETVNTVCTSCKEDMPKLTQVKELMDTVKSFKTDLAIMKEQVDKIKTLERIGRDQERRLKLLEEKSEEETPQWKELKDKVDEIQKPDWPTLIESVEFGKVIESQQTSILGRMEEKENKLREDLKEAERRKQNGIIHNIKESESEDNDDRIKHDEDKIQEFLDLCGADPGIKPISMFRIGNRPTAATNPAD